MNLYLCELVTFKGNPMCKRSSHSCTYFSRFKISNFLNTFPDAYEERIWSFVRRRHEAMSDFNKVCFHSKEFVWRSSFCLRYVFIFLLFSSKADLKHSCKICLRSSSVSFFFESFGSLNKRSGTFTSPIFCFLPEPLPSVNVVPPPGKGKEFRITNLTRRCVMIICFHLSSGIMCYGR